MQIFVKQPISGPTLVFDCCEKTTLSEFLQWVEDRTAIQENFYYITHNSHYLAKNTVEQKSKTFEHLGIKKGTTVQLNGRMYVNPSR